MRKHPHDKTAMDVRCPACRAWPGQECADEGRGVVRGTGFHAAREVVAAKVREQALRLQPKLI